MSIAGKTPTEFGLVVEYDADLSITSKTKMRHSFDREITFTSEGHEYTTFKRDKNIIMKNNQTIKIFKLMRQTYD